MSIYYKGSDYMANKIIISTPSIDEVEKYLKKWDSLDNYVLQENSLNKLFYELVPNNKCMEDILIKASTLNDFYSTNIFSIFPVAKHILKLDIDERLKYLKELFNNDYTGIMIDNEMYGYKTFNNGMLF